jgi:hypothetical protein
MYQRRSIGRTIQVGIFGAVGLLCALPAASETLTSTEQSEAPVCAAAYNTAREREQSGHLVAAGQLFLTCAKTTCGGALWQDCATRYTQLRAQTPSVIPLVTDDAGQPRVDVEVKMDGAVLISRLDGRSLPVDPGTHEFSFSAQGAVFASQRVTLQNGQRNRLIAVSVHSPTSCR